MLSRDCDGCEMLHMCSERYRRVGKHEKVYCPDGTAHLVDEEAEFQFIPFDEQCAKQTR